MNLFPPNIEGCVWTKPGIRKWTNKDLPIVCLAQQQPWGAKNISRIMWTMLTLIPITNKDISYNRKNILEDRQLFRALSSHSVPLWPWKNWYCRIWSRSETNHRNEDGQSAASELIVSCGEYANSSGPRYINRPVEIGMPKWGTCQTSEPTEVFSHKSIWMNDLCVTNGVEVRKLKLKVV